MIKKIIIIICLSILLFLSCSYFFRSNNQKSNNTPEVNKSLDVIEKKQINKKELTITYYEGNMLDEELPYGNKITKKIKVENNNNESVAFSLKFKEADINNLDVTYGISFSDDGEKYEKLVIEKNALVEDQTLYYNLAVNAKSKIYFKIEILASNPSITTLKGILSVETNLADKELFVIDFNSIKDTVVKKVQSIGGIETKGVYTLDITSLQFNDLSASYRGIVLIDTRDYSFIKYIYNIYSDKIMLLNYNSDTELKANLIKQFNKNDITNLNEETICDSYYKKGCSKFGTLPKSNKRTTASFTFVVNDILNISSSKIKEYNLTTSGYVYDIQALTNKYKDIRGFIIVDNTNNKKDIYINITDNFYSVLGYNYSKYGPITERSGTLRMYVELNYNQSSENKEIACKFIGLTKCL